jgi:hypothetical protein
MDYVPELVTQGKRSAARHGVRMEHGTPNEARGNCTYESVISNINDREDFSPDQKIELDPKQARVEWVTELQTAIAADYPDIIPDNVPDFNAEELWDKVKQDGVYEIPLIGDLVLNAIARGAKKVLLIFNTSPHAQDPIYVVEPERFGGERDSDVPVCLVYNQVHYESMHPVMPQDVEKTQDLVSQYLDGTYQFKKADIGNLIMPFNDTEKKRVKRTGVATTGEKGPAKSSTKRSRELRKDDTCKKKQNLAEKKRKQTKRGNCVHRKEDNLANKKRMQRKRGNSVLRKEENLAEKKRKQKKRGNSVQRKEENLSEKKRKQKNRGNSVQRKEDNLANKKRMQRKRGNCVQRKEDNLANKKRMQKKRGNSVQRKEENQRKVQQRMELNIDRDTGFEAICCICMEFKSNNVCSYSIDNLSDLAKRKYCYQTSASCNMNGQFYACNDCRRRLREKQVPPKSQRDLFQLSSFPQTFHDQLKDKMMGASGPMLNKLEQFLLKLVIPFIRVAHCKRGPYLQVRGNLILISSDVAQSMQKILPFEQNILPVSFKRKVSYDGHYIREMVDKRKVELYFNWMKNNNPLFADFTKEGCNRHLLQQFEDDLCASAEEVRRMAVPQEEGEYENDDDDMEDEIDVLTESSDAFAEQQGEEAGGGQQHPTLMCNKYQEDHEASTVANRLASLIVHLEEGNHLPKHVTDEVINDNTTSDLPDFHDEKFDVEDEVLLDEEIDEVQRKTDAMKQRARLQSRAEGLSEGEAAQVAKMNTDQRNRALKRMRTLSLAPGENGEFRNWKEDVFIEEKAFPHLFPYGTGGYLSSCLSSGKNMGFAVYCRNRLKSADPKYRNDQIYIMFLLLVKESMELKNCKSTYLRQARNTPGLTAGAMTDVRYQSLDRYSRSFSVYKNMRGTAMYYEAAKKNLMATLRQQGAPTVFITLSSAEYHWVGLLKSVYEAVHRRPATDEVIASMSASEKSRLITDNVVQTTIHFQKRIEKILNRLLDPHFLEEETGDDQPKKDKPGEDADNGKKASYFYRIEFQARGAPHVHLLAWLKDKHGTPAPSLLNSTQEDIEQRMQDVAEYHDKIIHCLIEEGEDETLKDNIERFQQHKCGFTCHKRKKMVTILENEGHACGERDPNKMVELTRVPVCRFIFPRAPMDETKVLLGFKKDEDGELVKTAKKDYVAIRKFLLRQTFVPERAKRHEQEDYKRLVSMDFITFLKKIGMFTKVPCILLQQEMFEQARTRYHTALKAGIKGYASVFPKRDMKNLFTNNFNKKLMRIHQANHDIQLCIDPYSVAQYVIGYLSKNESGMSALLKKVDEECTNLSDIEKINKLASILDKHREVSIQECVYRLLGLPMAKFSLRVKYLNTSHPKHRDGLLKSNVRDLEADEAAFHSSPHQYYENRKLTDEGMEDMCLADWYTLHDYSASGTKPNGAMELENKMGWFRQRSRGGRAVLRYYLPIDDDVELARGLCILFLPFKNELQEIHKDPKNALALNQDTINKNRAKFEQNDMISDMIKQIEKERDKAPLSDDESEDGREEETTERYQVDEQVKEYDKHKAKQALPKDDTTENYLDPVELRKLITFLNSQQRHIFDDILERVTDGDLEDNPFFCYIAGEAGTGKSHLIKLLIYAIRQLKAKSGQDLDKPSVVVMAPTANAAFLIKGKTIESAMRINMERYNSFSKASADRQSQLAFEYQDVAAVVCDEISMVGTNKLTAINFTMQSLAEGPKKNEFMGGKSFIAAGDLRQLPPVRDKYVFEKSTLDGRPSVAPCHWSENFKIYYLTEKMRCPDDITFAELCDRVGTDTITDQDEEFLQRCVRAATLPCEEVNDNFTSGRVAIITTTNEQREAINLEKLRSLLPHQQEYVCLSQDKISDAKNYVPRPDTVSYDVRSTKAKGGMVKNLIIREGAPVMVTDNHKTARYKEDGIVNSAMGYIDHIQTSRENPDLVELIWVVFQNREIGARCYRREKRCLRPRDSEGYLSEDALPILPVRKHVEVEQNNTHYIRTQFPLTLAYAMTAHKCQGRTLDEVIVDFRPNEKGYAFIDKGSFYVAITRVREAAKLHLRSFKRSHIVVNPRVEYEINTMKRVRAYQMKKVHLKERIFDGGEELKVGYFNMNSLLDGYHAEYLNGDRNLCNLDVLAVAESKMCAEVSDEQIQNVLPKWDIVARYDAPDGAQHMGLLLLASKESKLGSEVQVGNHFHMDKNGQTQVQAMECSVRRHAFIFVYCRESPNLAESEWLRRKASSSHYVLGDLNLDPNVPDQKRKILIICAQDRKPLLIEITTKNDKQLDHILGPERVGVKIFTTSFMNFVSDHKAITMRISLSGAGFVEDPRLPMTSEPDQEMRSLEEDADPGQGGMDEGVQHSGKDPGLGT